MPGSLEGHLTIPISTNHERKISGYEGLTLMPQSCNGYQLLIAVFADVNSWSAEVMVPFDEWRHLLAEGFAFGISLYKLSAFGDQLTRTVAHLQWP